MKRLLLSIFFIIFLAACSPVVTSAPQTDFATVAPPTATLLPTSTPLPSPTPAPEFPIRDGGTMQPSAAVISRDNLAQLAELAVWGKGVIRGIRWSADGQQIFVDTALGRYVYDAASLQLVEDGLGVSDDRSKLSFNVEDLGASTDSAGHIKHPFKVSVTESSTGKSLGSFDVDASFWPTIAYMPESNLISVTKIGGVELRDGTSYEIFYTLGWVQYVFDSSDDGSYSFQSDDHSAIAVSPDRSIVATGQFDGKIILRSGEEFNDNLTLEMGGPVRFLSLSPDGKKLVAETNGNISIWDTSSGKVIGTLPNTFLSGNFFYDQYHFRMGLAVKENKLAYINKDIVISIDLLNGNKSDLIDVKEGSRLDKQENGKYGHPEYQPVYNIFFSANGQTLVTMLEDRAYVWDLNTNQFIKMIALDKKNQGYGLMSAYSATNNLLFTGSPTGNYLKIWNVDSGIELPSIYAWGNGSLAYGYDGTHSLTMSPDGKYIFSWSGLEGVASLWDVETQARAMSLKIPRSEYSKYKPGFYPVAISPDNTKLIFSYSLEPGSHIAKVYSIPDGAELSRITSYFATFSPDGSVIAASVGNSRIRFYDAQTGSILGDVVGKYPNRNGFQLLYFSEDGKNLFAVSTNGTISVWGAP